MKVRPVQSSRHNSVWHTLQKNKLKTRNDLLLIFPYARCHMSHPPKLLHRILPLIERLHCNSTTTARGMLSRYHMTFRWCRSSIVSSITSVCMRNIAKLMHDLEWVKEIDAPGYCLPLISTFGICDRAFPHEPFGKSLGYKALKRAAPCCTLS